MHSADARGGRGGRRAAGAVIPGHRPRRRRGGMTTSRVSAEHPPRLAERALGELMPRQQTHVSLAASQQGRISAIPSAEFRARPAAAGLGGDSRRITAMPAGVSAYSAARCECAPARAQLATARPRESRCCGPSLPAPYVSLCAAATALPLTFISTTERWGRWVGSSPVPPRARANDCFVDMCCHLSSAAWARARPDWNIWHVGLAPTARAFSACTLPRSGLGKTNQHLRRQAVLLAHCQAG